MMTAWLKTSGGSWEGDDSTEVRRACICFSLLLLENVVNVT